jgi:hypothetical protein
MPTTLPGSDELTKIPQSAAELQRFPLIAAFWSLTSDLLRLPFGNDSSWRRHCALGNLGTLLVGGCDLVEPSALARRSYFATTLPPHHHCGLRPSVRIWSSRSSFRFLASVGRIVTVLTAVGFGLAWWARLHLGKLWSAFVTRKDEHRVIETGPYGIVRHPIYTGIILAAVTIAILKANLYTCRRISYCCRLLDQSASRRTFPQPGTRSRNLRRLSPPRPNADSFVPP